jgi:hypothetical protein
MVKRVISVELEFSGPGRVERIGTHAFRGGVEGPSIDSLRFSVCRQVVDEAGMLNPVIGEPTEEGSFQINLWGDSHGYRELGRYFLALAELDATEDDGFHEHFDDLVSEDGRTHLHVIVRKDRP